MKMSSLLDERGLDVSAIVDAVFQRTDALVIGIDADQYGPMRLIHFSHFPGTRKGIYFSLKIGSSEAPPAFSKHSPAFSSSPDSRKANPSP